MSDYIRVALWLSDHGQKYTFGTANLALDGFAPVAAPFGRGPISIKGMHLIQIDTKRSEIGTYPLPSSYRFKPASGLCPLNLEMLAGP